VKPLWLIFWLWTTTLMGQQTLTLEAARQMALKNNKTLQAAKATAHAARQDKKGAFTHFLPAVTAAGNVQRMHKSFKYETPDMALPVADAQGNVILVTDGAGNPVTGADGKPIVKNWAVLPSQTLSLSRDNLSFLSIGITQPLFTGGKVLHQYKARTALAKAAASGLYRQRAELMLKTDMAYWRVAELVEKTALARQYCTLIQKHMDDLNNLKAEGVITKNDVLKVTVKENEAQLNRLKAENGLKLSQMALCQLLGLPLDTVILTADTPEAAQGPAQVKTPQPRPEIEMLDQAVALAGADVGLQRSRYFPNLLAHAHYTWMNPNPWNSLADEFGSDWSVGVGLQWDLFHWNERGFKLSAAKSRRKAALRQREEAREMVDLEIRQARFQCAEADKRHTMAQSSLEAADENLRLTQEQFSEGVAASTDVLDAQTLWQNAHTELIEAQIERRLSQTRLEKALGCLGKDR